MNEFGRNDRARSETPPVRRGARTRRTIMNIIPAVSHTDHNLSAEHIAFILAICEGRTGFFIAELTLPDELPAIPCGLHGPKMGDGPIPESECMRVVRGNRPGPSRLCLRAPRPTRTVTVIAGPAEGEPCVLYTAYGGPIAPREPWDDSLASDEAHAESLDFWHDHALSVKS